MKQSKIIKRYDRRMNGWQLTQNSLKGNQAGYKRPGSRNPKKLRNR
jgi:hypothetical protein